MTYVKVDDQFPEHPKVIDIGPLAEALWLRGLCYASRNLTDGFVPLGYLKRMGDLDAIALATSLADAGLWQECEGGYRVHQYSDWQRTREEIDAIAEVRAEAGRRGGLAKAHNVANAKQIASTLLSSKPSKTYPDTASDTDTDTEHIPPIVPPRGDVVKSKPRRRIPDSWRLTPTLRGYAIDHGIPASEVEEFAAEFKRYWQGDGRPKADWDLTFMGRVRDQAGRYQARASPNGSNGLKPEERRPAIPMFQGVERKQMSPEKLEQVRREVELRRAT